jgi:hypothetical protein
LCGKSEKRKYRENKNKNIKIRRMESGKLRDVTERKNYENRLRLLARKLKTCFKFSSIVFSFNFFFSILINSLKAVSRKSLEQNFLFINWFQTITVPTKFFNLISGFTFEQISGVSNPNLYGKK